MSAWSSARGFGPIPHTGWSSRVPARAQSASCSLSSRSSRIDAQQRLGSLTRPAGEVVTHSGNPDPVIATLNRQMLKRAGVMAVNIVGGPGSGKTTLILRALERLGRDHRVG